MARATEKRVERHVPEPKAREQAATPLPLTVEAIRALNRTIGNRAVGRLLRAQRDGATVDATAGRKALPERADAELVSAAEDAVASGTVSLAIYTAVPGVEREFLRAAKSFAADHRSLGVRGGRLVSGARAAMAVTSTDQVVAAVNETIARLRLLVDRPDVTVDSLALFAHGVNASRMPGGRSYLNLTGGHQIANEQQAARGHGADKLSAASFAEQITAALGDRARVILYACELGDAYQGGENGNTWNAAQKAQARHGALADELAAGDTSFADEMRDLLNATGAHREVWGHRTTGHTTANASWRQFGGDTRAGAENVFGDERASADVTPEQGWELHNRNLRRARSVVSELARALGESPTIEASTLRQLARRGHGLRGWIARELPFAPTPFVTGEPPAVRAEVVRFLEAQAELQAPPRP